MKNLIKHLPPNEHGRDFVIGDLHGSLVCLQNLMNNLAFDKAKDRIISVGDLVDRGPNSLECLELLKEPWFHCVLANHEQMMLAAFDDGYVGQFWMQNGGLWGSNALREYKDNKRVSTNELDHHEPAPDSRRLWAMLELVRELPLLITVELPAGTRVHVIHAELPPGLKITDADLSSVSRVEELARMQSPDNFFLWGRNMFAPFYDVDLSHAAKIKRSIAFRYRDCVTFNDELSHIVSGHTIMQRPLTILGQTNIDTKAYGSCKDKHDRRKWNALTALELQTWSFYQATPDEFRTVEALVVNMADIQALKNGRTPLIDALNQGHS